MTIDEQKLADLSREFEGTGGAEFVPTILGLGKDKSGKVDMVAVDPVTLVVLLRRSKLLVDLFNDGPISGELSPALIDEHAVWKPHE